MFEKILIVCETMPNFNYVLQAVNNLKQIGVRECVLLKCISFGEVNDTVAAFMTSVYQSNLELNRQALLDSGFKVKSRETVGQIRGEANRIAADEGCSLIVAAASRNSLLGSLFFGGAGELMLHGVELPLLLVRVPPFPTLDTLEQVKQNLLGRILFPTDFSENASRAFAVVKDLVTEGVDKVLLVHVQDKTRVAPHLVDRLNEFNRTDHERLQGLAHELRSIRPCEVDTRLPFGSPTAELLKIIAEDPVTLVVMGSQGRGFIKEIYLGSVSHNVARHSAVSVLLVPMAAGSHNPGSSN